MITPAASSLNIAASLAGSDRAAVVENAAQPAKGGRASANPGVGDATVDRTEKVAKSDLTGDSEADGRQMLDTFERRHRDESEQPVVEETRGEPQRNRPVLGGHIDLCG